LEEAVGDSRHLALLVYDMQVGILSQLADGDRVLGQVRAAQSQLAPELAPTSREAVLDKITMSAFEGTWLDIALRDCGVTTVVVVGVALEIGVEPTARHAADLGYIPVVLTDACGAGDPQAGQRSLDSLRFTGDTLLTDVDQFCAVLAQSPPGT
jgi:nicotinamidase-related amidase